jgi:hypothetical protein
MCKEMPVIPVKRVTEKKNRKYGGPRWRIADPPK